MPVKIVPDGDIKLAAPGICVKLAATFLGPFMPIEVGLVDPERSPDQFEKA
jgi:hypothetical protein